MSVLVKGILFAFVALTLISLADAQSERRSKQRKSIAGHLKSLDKNRDGKLSANELPQKQRERWLGRADVNQDGMIDAEELKQLTSRGSSGRQPEEPEQEDIGKETATHREIEPLPIQFAELKSLRLCDDGNLMAGDTKDGVIKIISPAGELVNTIDPGLPPEVLDLAADGSIYCGGDGRVTKLSAGGRVLKAVEIPDEIEDDAAPSRGGRREPGLSGLVVADDAIYVTFGSGWSVSSKAQLFRFDLDLENPVLVADGFRGCCQHCDLAFRDGVLYVAENAAFRIVSFDGLGELIGKWGSKSRGDLKLFGGCCNPMSITFGPDNVLYTAESGMGRVKRYTPAGEFLGLVGYLDTARFSRGSGFAAACCHIPIAVTLSGNRVYVADVKENIIRVLQRKR